ncbi:MAG TPA: pyridoxine 5'-phosphate synthase [Pirellulales bacterium]|nr:pyridoxine 5'-phosphate synthase [Pirellulales bacterium]
MVELGVNIDHVATVREARRTNEPDPVWAATLAQLGGADGITLHLREDRRHIQDRDLRILRETVTVKLNLELACNQDVLEIACHTRPDQATLVPERREEVTTEGGLLLALQPTKIAAAMRRLQEAGIKVSLFLDPDPAVIDLAVKMGADAVELHTGQYALATDAATQAAELARLTDAGKRVLAAKLALHAGHGLTYRNVRPIAAIAGMGELNIGHSIVARAIMVGFEQAVREMKKLIS